MSGPRPSTLWLKTLRDLWLFRGRTLMVVLAIAVGTAAAGVCVTSLIVLRRDLREGYQRTNPAHAILSTTPFDTALADRVARLPEVTAATARRQTQAQLLTGESPRTLVLATIPDFAAADIGRLMPQSGAQVPPGTGTILLERSAVAVLSLGVGDPLTVRMSDGDTFPLSLAGAVHDMAVAPTTVQPVVFGYISDQTAARLGLPETYNQLLVTVRAGNPDREAVESAVTAVTEWLADEGVLVLRADIPEPGVHEMQGSVDTGLLMIGILGGLTLLLSAFLVTNVMAAVVAQQTPQIGVLKALGGSRRLVLRQYGRMVIIFGLLALVLAVPLGYMGAYFQSSYLAGQLNFDIPSFGLTAATLVVQIIGAVGIPLLAALGSLRAAGALSIRDALSSRGGAPSAGELATRLEGLSRPAAMTLRNILRRKGRLALTLAALALAGAMFMATFGLRLGLYEAVEILVGEFPFDVQVDLTEPQPARRLLRETEGLPGLERAEAWGVADARRVYPDGRLGTSVTLYGVPPTAQISSFAERAGQWLSAGAADEDTLPAVYINYEAERLIDRPQVGDDLLLRLDGERERAARLVGISLRPFVPQAYMSLADFERATGRRDQMGRLVVYLEGDDAQRQSAAAGQLAARFEAAGIIVARMDTAADIREGYLAQFNTLVLLLMALAGLTALVGGLGLGNTMALNTMERAREIGVLRALGARRAWLRRLVLAEGVVVALVSVIPAVLLSLPLTAALDRVMGVSLLGSPLRFAFAPWAAVGWTALLLVITLVACWLPAENAARMTVREALGYE